MRLYKYLYIVPCLICLLFTSCSNDISSDLSEPTKKYKCYYKSLGEKLPNGEDATTIYISNLPNSRDKEYIVMSFGNKLRTPNINFDLKDVFVYPQEDSAIIYNDADSKRIFGHQTDNIQPIRFRVVNNANGDFAHSGQTYFTGGFHGYANNTDGNAAPTSYEEKKEVYVNGRRVNLNDTATGSVVTIKNISLLQASNTEKLDGKGRYALKQEITVNFRNDTAFVQIDYTPLEDIIVYQVNGLAFFNDLRHIQFIGSQTKQGIYPNNKVNRSDRNTSAIRQFDNLYRFDVFIDSKFGIGNLEFNKADYNAEITEVQKSYFHLIDNLEHLPLTFLRGEKFSLRGGYVFRKNK